MFDFHKCSITGVSVNDLLNNDLLEFTRPYVCNTGELKENTKTAIYRELKFVVVNDKHINLKGSFHKYHNSGNHNYNDFSISECLTVLTELTEKFKINPFFARLHNLEYGVNVTLPFDANMFLNSVISYKGKEYQMERFDGKGYLLRFIFQQYELKIYNKGFQYGIGTNLLRFEIKVKKMEYFKIRNIDLTKLSDLLNWNNYDSFKNDLLQTFNDLMIYDNSIDLKKLPNREREVLTNGRNPKFWVNLLDINPNQFKKKRERFRSLVLQHGKQSLQKIVYSLIENKCSQMLTIDNIIQKNITSYLNLFDSQTLPELTDFENANITRINPSSIELERVNIKRFCLSCNRDITAQRKGSVFCSELLFGKEAKKCRNQNSNPRNNYFKREYKLYSGLLLFDVNTYKQENKLNNQFKSK